MLGEEQNQPSGVVVTLVAVSETPEAIAYAESIRAVEQQSRKLDEPRSCTGLLLAGASVVTSFLGAAALDRGGVDALAVLAILTFLAVIGLALSIPVPRTKGVALHARCQDAPQGLGRRPEVR